MNKVIIICAGGHSKVIADIIKKSGDEVLGFLDDNKAIGEKVIQDFTILGKIEECEKFQAQDSMIRFIIAIGNNSIRKQISEKYNLNYYIAIHPSSCIGMDVELGEGTVIMANTTINPSTKIGKHCIINTGAIIEHDNVIQDYVHISPNGTLCGTVEIGELCHIGAGALIKNNIKVTNNCIIGVGGVVVKNIEEEGIYVGVPVRKIK